MRLKTTYMVLCFLGLLLPYSQFIPWLLQHGLNIDLFLRELLANGVSMFFAADLLLSAVVLIIFIWAEDSSALGRWKWTPTIALLTVGVSLALPLFLYLREVAPKVERAR
jgi:hypothetical protein